MKVNFFNVLLAVIMLFTIQAGQAETFRWVDEFGKIRIGIKPPDNSANVEKNKDENEKINKTISVITKPITPKAIDKQAESVIKTTENPKITPPVEKPVPAPLVVVPEASSSTKPLEAPQPPKAAQQVTVKKTTPVKKKSTRKKPEIRKNVVRKKTKEASPVKKEISTKKSSRERNEEMCGVFTGYVVDYDEKVRNCSLNLCDIYKRSLARYKKKQNHYCK